MDDRHGPAGLTAADAAALLVVMIWGTNFVFNKALLEQFDVLTFMFLRYAGMLAVGWMVLLARSGLSRAPLRDAVLKVKRADLPRLALSGFLGYVCYIPLSTYGLYYTTAFSGALLIATAAIFAALLLRLLRMERIVPVQWLAMVLAFVGVSVFLSEKIQSGRSSAGFGDVVSLAGAFFFAAYTVANKPLLARYPAPVVTAYTLTIGAIPVLALSLTSVLSQDWSRVSVGGWGGLLWSIVVPVYFAWTVWSWASARIGVARISMFMYLVPVAGGVTSWLLLGERFGPLKAAGAFVVLAGLVLTRVGARRPGLGSLDVGSAGTSRGTSPVAGAPASLAVPGRPRL